MMDWILVVLGLVVLGRFWVCFPVGWGRLMGWLGLAVGLVLINWLLRDGTPVLRMIGLCCGLLAGLKGIVHAEWGAARGRALPWGRYLGFGLLWFGMDPGAFVRQREGLEWKTHLRIGLGCMLTGTLLALGVRALGWTNLLLVFVPMSIGFHFGALRVLTAAWRAGGFPARVLFRNPLVTTGLGDFWAKRWNLGYSEMMIRVVKRPLENFLGRRGADGAVFLISGLLHEVAITVPVGMGYGRPTLYFLLNGVATHLERTTWPQSVRRLWALAWVVLPIGLLFPEDFKYEVILTCLEVLPRIGGAF